MEYVGPVGEIREVREDQAYDNLQTGSHDHTPKSSPIVQLVVETEPPHFVGERERTTMFALWWQQRGVMLGQTPFVLSNLVESERIRVHEGQH